MNRHWLPRVVAACAIGSALSLLAPTVAHATPGRTYLPFQPGVVSDCGAFAVSVTPVIDKEYQTVRVLADGTMVIQVTGDLTLRFINLNDPNKSVLANSPGPYTLTLNPDGTGTFTSIGLGINSFDPSIAAIFGIPLIAQVAGKLQLTFSPTGVTNLSVTGHVTDVCAEVA